MAEEIPVIWNMSPESITDENKDKTSVNTISNNENQINRENKKNEGNIIEDVSNTTKYKNKNQKKNPNKNKNKTIIIAGSVKEVTSKQIKYTLDQGKAQGLEINTSQILSTTNHRKQEIKRVKENISICLSTFCMIVKLF